MLSNVAIAHPAPLPNYLQRDAWQGAQNFLPSRATWDRARLSNRQPALSQQEGVQSDAEFRAVLERECARAIRHGHKFTLVTFEVASANREGVETARLIRVLTTRLRSTDEIGWVRDRQVGVLLYSTGSEDARRFVGHVRRELAREGAAPSCDAYPYPISGAQKMPDPPTDLEDREESRSQASPESVEFEKAKPRHPVFGTGLPVWKRLMDMVLSSLGLLVLAPLFCLIALYIKAVSRGPVFFRQERIGYMGRPFTLWKFRTMHVNNDTSAHRDYLANLINGKEENLLDSPMEKQENEAQIIRFGALFRKSCLDEFPQLINVLRGEMSLVGPRPPIRYEAEEYRRWHNGRFDAVPGMTGLWQVSGKNRLTFNQMARLDIRYAREKSIWLDIEIILRTPLAIAMQIYDCLAKRNQTVPRPRQVAENA